MMHEVFEKRDIVECIVCQIENGVEMEVSLKESVIHNITTLRAAQCVNRLFRDAATERLEQVMWLFNNEMRAFDAQADVVCTQWGPCVPEYMKLLEMSSWPLLVFGLNLYHPSNSQLVWALQQFQTRRDPTTPVEMLNLVERRCVCCGKRCPHIARRALKQEEPHIPWTNHMEFRAAWALHPYKGSTLQIGELTVLQGSLIPFTFEEHFLEVAFMHDKERGEFYARLHVYAKETREELRFSHFQRAAQNEPWYRARIKRLFDLRDEKLACVERSARRVSFLAHICMFEPRLSAPEDWSIASIFDLTPAEMRALIRRGSAMAREQWLLK